MACEATTELQYYVVNEIQSPGQKGFVRVRPQLRHFTIFTTCDVTQSRQFNWRRRAMCSILH